MSSLFQPDELIAGFARIAVERAVDRYPDGLTYAIPASLDQLAIGDRVDVPLGRGDTRTPGYVVELQANDAVIERSKIKSLDRRRDEAEAIPAQLVELGRWISNYYCAPIGVTLASMLPAAVKKRVGVTMRRLIDLGHPPPPEEKISPKQRAVLHTLAGLEEQQRPIDERALMELAGLRTASPVRRLLERGYVRQQQRSVVTARWIEQSADAFTPSALTRDQQNAIAAIAATLDGGFSAHLLYGVTGSGKTEVYIRLIEQVLARGKAAIMLVPEISLTPQTGGRLIGRFPNHRIALLHSALTAAQRNEQWTIVRNGQADVVLGARSAVFAPLPPDRLGLIIVDEEHDGSYKQDQTPRYHGRDVAIRRAQLARCPVLLGSATPSLESWHNAAPGGSGVWRLHRLPNRVPGHALPHVQLVDIRAEQQQRPRSNRMDLLGPTLERAMHETLAAGGQVLLLLNRRGYAHHLACPDARCGWVMQCDQCDVSLVFHRDHGLPSGGFVQCHHCLSQHKLPQRCPMCERKIIKFGLGTQRVEEELAFKFGGQLGESAMLRVDSDTMQSSRHYHEALERFGSGDVRLLVGTQMIAKGLDYPNVRLVGVVNADTAINLPDFRATERTFQLVSQVAGRSGRGTPGRVIVQSLDPGLPAIVLAARHDYPTFARDELAQRTRAGLPPSTRMSRIVVRDADLNKCQSRCAQLTAQLCALIVSHQITATLQGPAPCAIARISGRHRHQVLLLSPSAGEMQRLIAAARSDGLVHSSADMYVDVDPVGLM